MRTSLLFIDKDIYIVCVRFVCLYSFTVVSGEGVGASSVETESPSNPIFIRGEPIAAVTAICCTAVELYCFDSDMLISLGIRDDRQVGT